MYVSRPSQKRFSSNVRIVAGLLTAQRSIGRKTRSMKSIAHGFGRRMRTNMIYVVGGRCGSSRCPVCPLLVTYYGVSNEADRGHRDTRKAVSFSNWDVFWYTRGFPSMDTERSRRHASKLFYPMTIGSVLHQHSSLMLNNQRLTPEGSRSMAG